MRRLAALLAVVLLAGCSTEIDTSTRPNTVAGTYQLRTYGGRSLPALVSTDTSGVLQITGGELVIGEDKSWTETQNYTLTKNAKVQSVSVGSSGSWAFLRDFAYMVFNDKVFSYQFTGVAAGGSVTLDLDNGNSLIYSR